MTTKEKAERYDSLQVAIKCTLDGYRKWARYYERTYNRADELGVIDAYSKGLSDGFYRVIADLERWSDT